MLLTYLTNRYMSTETSVLVKPIHASYGINFILSDIFNETAPPVAWKKEPCGRESTTVAPAWIIAAAASPETPEANNVGENVWAATVAPAVVDAVAPAIKIPDNGRHIHCFKDICYIVLQCGSFDDTGNCSCADQKNGNTDNLGQTEFRIGNQILCITCSQGADDSTYRQSNQRIDGDACNRS